MSGFPFFPEDLHQTNRFVVEMINSFSITYLCKEYLWHPYYKQVTEFMVSLFMEPLVHGP